ncbi:MAG: M14 family metallopeptidase [Planctomycetota bacterium]
MTMLRMLLSAIMLMTVTATTWAQQHIPSRVDIAWNRYYDFEEMEQQLRDLAAAYPDIMALESIGKSVQGRDIWLVTLNVEKTGPDTSKPAMYIDGSIHANEVQATEVVMYSIWYLTKSYGTVDAITELMDDTAMYFVPCVSPDSRAHWFREPNSPNTQRSGQRPTDNDFDGVADEDGPDDLDGDGHIGSMFRFDPNGTWKRHPERPALIVRAGEDEEGELSWAGQEGIDNDGDGRINEDGAGGYDMNRNWPAGWQPSFIQRGAGEFPLCFPETRAIAMFILDKPNIAAAQSYHNTGGMILRGPGAPYRSSFYPRADLRVYDALAEAGEEMIPFYNYLIIHEDLYTVHGGTVNWAAEGLGIISFTNELWTTRQILQSNERTYDADARQRWQDRILFGQTQTLYTEHDHPTLGRVLIGGGTKYASRSDPPFMLEQSCHRNFAFTMYHASEMPSIQFDHVATRDLGNDVWEVTVEILNEKIIPTRTAVAAQKRIGTPDRLIADGASVITAGRIANRFATTMTPVAHRPERLLVNEGIPSEGRRAFRYLVSGQAGDTFTLRYEAEKCRDIETTVTLESE